MGRRPTTGQSLALDPAGVGAGPKPAVGTLKWKFGEVQARPRPSSRTGAPKRLAYKKGNPKIVKELDRSVVGIAAAVDAYEKGKLAPGARHTLSSRIAFWERRAKAHSVPLGR